MKYYILAGMVMFLLSVEIIACRGNDDPEPETEHPIFPDDPDDEDTSDDNMPAEPGGDNVPADPDNTDNTHPMSNNLRIIIGPASFNVVLEENATVVEFKALLPMTVNMTEMNSNEKYYYLPENLPVVSSYPSTIRIGDLMLYGSSCIVLFYKTFSTSYSYTRLGRVDNPSGLAAALGKGNVNVTFELQ